MNPSTDKTYLFEQMPVSQAVRRQILPSIASQMVLLLYNLADTYFVGLLNDPPQTAAVSVAYTITVLMTAIANLFAVGGASCMARAMGRHDTDSARRTPMRWRSATPDGWSSGGVALWFYRRIMRESKATLQ